jgi:hypothetical protein
MSLPLKQAIIQKNRLRPSKVTNNLVRACIAGNTKNKQNFTLYQGISRQPLGIKIRDWYQN